MRISDWSSDVCSSDLARACAARRHRRKQSHAGPGDRADKKPSPLPGQGWGPGRTDERNRPLPRGRGPEPADDKAKRSPQRRERGYDETRSEEHTSELQSQMRISYAVFCLKKTNEQYHHANNVDHFKHRKNKTDRIMSDNN